MQLRVKTDYVDVVVSDNQRDKRYRDDRVLLKIGSSKTPLSPKQATRLASALLRVATKAW